MTKIVLDTNVLVSALISRRGASFQLVQRIGTGLFEICISAPIVLEYEETLKRLSGNQIALSLQQIDDVVDYLCAVGKQHQVYYLLRPLLPDPRDDMVAELAVTAQAEAIVTYNVRDFQGLQPFGIRVITAKEFLSQIGVFP